MNTSPQRENTFGPSCSQLCCVLSSPDTDSANFSIPFDRQGPADYLAVDRSGLSAEMSKLKKEGILYYHKSDFRLLNLPRKDTIK